MVVKSKSKKPKKQKGKKGKLEDVKKKVKPRDHDDTEIKSLEIRITTEAPKSGTGAFAPDSSKTKEASGDGGPALTTRLFKDLPISARTLKALEQAGFTKTTEIQRGAIPHALAGRDVLGEAKTGSGKTLAFLVPLIELLYRQKWTRMDGLGGLIVSPTRELSYQIYQVLTAVGAEHDLSAGCVVGGRNLGEEQQSVISMNILVATPGRLLQHLDETPGFDASALQMLALDEADRILDFGFQETIHHILSHLTKERQSMLFSATLHNSVHRLGRVALKSPEMVSVHRNSTSRTPEKLKQVCMMVPLDQKIDMLFSFLRSHSQKKMIVFVSACKQVRFLYESFRQLKPGPAVMELHGRQSLTKRMVIFKEFSDREKAVVLFCTDIAARGVDFPVVDWVLQFDCPESVDSYVHRVGRTARYESSGSSALFLAPSEEAFINKLKAQRIEAKTISAKSGKVQSIREKIQALVAGDGSIKHLAQKALISYVRSVQLMKDKEVFKMQSLPIEEFALSLGLIGVPEGLGLKIDEQDPDKNPEKMKKNRSALQRLKEKIKKKKESAPNGDGQAPEADDDDSASDELQRPTKKKLSRWERRQQRIEKMEAARETTKESKDEEEDDLLVPVASSVDSAPLPKVDKKQKLKIRSDGIAAGSQGTHIFFAGKKGQPSSALAQIAEDQSSGKDSEVVTSTKESRQAFLKRVSSDLASRDVDDAAKSRARIHELHKKRRRLAKEDRRDDDGDEESAEDVGVTLGGADSRSASPASGPSDDSGGEDIDDTPQNAKATPARKDEFHRNSRQGNPVDASDDLGALEQQALSKLGGLF